MPYGASSTASSRVNAEMAPLAALYGPRPGRPTMPAVDETETIGPAALAAHSRDGQGRAVEHPEEVDVDDLAPRLGVVLLGPPDALDAGVVDEDVEAPLLASMESKARSRGPSGR